VAIIVGLLSIWCFDWVRNALSREEGDREANRAEWLHSVFDIGWYCLGRVGLYHYVEDGFASHDETHPSLIHVNLAPSSPAHSVGTEQSDRNRLLIPNWGRPSEPETLRRFGPIAQWAVESCSDPFGPFLGIDNPGPNLEGWLVTNVLAVPAREFGDIVAVVITVETHDRSHHASTVSVRSYCTTGAHAL